MYPAGTWEGGPLDLAGNVWEWCLNKYGTPKVTQPDVSEHSRVVRGGSCGYVPGSVRASSPGGASTHTSAGATLVFGRVARPTLMSLSGRPCYGTGGEPTGIRPLAVMSADYGLQAETEQN
jgi:hypothetical protein